MSANIADKPGRWQRWRGCLFLGGVFGIYDEQVGEGTVSFPMPWASTADPARLPHHRTISRRRCGRLHPVEQHDETAAAEGFFKHVLRPLPTEPGKAPDPFRNLAAHIEAGGARAD